MCPAELQIGPCRRTDPSGTTARCSEIICYTGITFAQLPTHRALRGIPDLKRLASEVTLSQLPAAADSVGRLNLIHCVCATVIAKEEKTVLMDRGS
jgi:hypothetical protein